MKPMGGGGGNLTTVGYRPDGLKLAFHETHDCTARQCSSNDAYWKIGITVKDLDHAVSFLHVQGVTVSKPAQFLDIGYLCHLQDPAGLSVELLQQGFEGNETKMDANDNDSHPIGGQATLAHITIRRDTLGFQEWCQDTMKMRLLSIQPVNPYGFTLYFYSWSDESLPDPNDLNSVENRPWLWARPYGLLEIQHTTTKDPFRLRPTAPNECGPIEILVVDETEGHETTQRIDCSKDLGL